MATTVWKGHLTFGLVSIPVRMVRAARPEKVSLHQVYRPARTATREPEEEHVAEIHSAASVAKPFIAAKEQDITPVSRVQQRLLDPVEQTPIPSSEILKGYEYAKDQYVVIDKEDIRKLTPQTGTEMQIVEFVRLAEIDPVYLETSYYMIPDGAGEKPYALLFEGMRETGYVALAEVAMHRREHVMILRPGRNGIISHTMFYSDEVRTIEEFRTDKSLVTPKELGLAKTLIEALAAPFEPAKFKDKYRERLRQLIEAKAEGRELAQAAPQPAAKVVDIMEALQKSLAAVKREETPPRMPVKAEKAAAKPKSRRGGSS
ncbi:MAG TPA: Ku protein [Bryobacteraceae bacterium]|nr:Ku protein [Bryobacteraceae bacterium]